MSEIRFEWDDRKARANLTKHGVSFEEASTAFYDELGLLLDDPDATVEEDRFILLGLSSRMRLLVVVHVFGNRTRRFESFLPGRPCNRRPTSTRTS